MPHSSNIGEAPFPHAIAEGPGVWTNQHTLPHAKNSWATLNNNDQHPSGGKGAGAALSEALLPNPVDYRITIPRLFKNTAFSREKRQSLKTACKSG